MMRSDVVREILRLLDPVCCWTLPGYRELAVYPANSGSVLDLDARLVCYECNGRERVALVLPGSDSLKDWLWNLLPGRVRLAGVEWREAFFVEAERLLLWEALRRHVPDLVVGFSRGAAVGYVLAHLARRHVWPYDPTIWCVGAPKVVRRGAASLPRLLVYELAGTRDVVAWAPLTTALGWKLPVSLRVPVPGAWHSVRSYLEHWGKIKHDG